jgi:hypothetical protein
MEQRMVKVSMEVRGGPARRTRHTQEKRCGHELSERK